MERRYAVAVLVIGMALFLSNGALDTGIGHLGMFLVVAVGGALLWDIIRERRGASR